jgi:hypothetical protein
MKRKINFLSRIHLCCSHDELRPSLSHVYFENGYAVATDAHVLLKQKLSLICDVPEWADILEGKFIHYAAFEKIIKAPAIKVENEGVRCIYPFYETLYSYSIPGKYPDYNIILEQAKKDRDYQPDYNEIGLTPSILDKLTKAMYFDETMKIKLSLPEKNNKGIIITAIGISEGDQCAILMPAMID